MKVQDSKAKEEEKAVCPRPPGSKTLKANNGQLMF